MKRNILILAACACAFASAGVMSARLGGLGRNDTVVTNVTDVTPGNYETVSNRAMTASSYTDAVAGTLRGKGDLTVYGYAPFIVYSYDGVAISPPVRMNYTTIAYSGGGSAVGWLSESQLSGSYALILNDLKAVEYLIKSGEEYIVGSGDLITVSSDKKSITAFGSEQVDIRRESTGMDYPTGNSLATTNDIPRTAGGQEWRVVDVHSFDGDELRYVTNGITRLYLGDYVMLSTNGWPEGAAMYVQGIKEYDSWYPAPEMRLVGYGTWPTNNFQSVWWRSGTNIYVNVILEE